jgi:hypothetical protein
MKNGDKFFYRGKVWVAAGDSFMCPIPGKDGYEEEAVCYVPDPNFPHFVYTVLVKDVKHE